MSYLQEGHQYAWLLWLRLWSWLHPFEVVQKWTSTSAEVVLKQDGDESPEAFLSEDAPVALQLLQISDSHISQPPLVGLETHGRRMHDAFHHGGSCVWNGSQVQPAAMFRELLDVARAADVDVPRYGSWSWAQ